jgi:outer membrane protein assembly factor BamD
MVRNAIRYSALLGAVAALLFSSGCRKKAYENPITKDTQQPDKVLFDTAIDDIEHGRYERARLTLQTLMNTYDTSEYLAKAKLAVADSWYREGGAHGMAQAEAEYKDFILFYHNMEEAAEAQEKICKMQYQQMDKSDRDPLHAYRAQEECKNLLTEFPNSKFAPEALQYLRDVQEVLADEEYKVGVFYQKKGSFPASANRLQALSDQYPLYSRAADALWAEADSYQRMGDNFENQQVAAYDKIVQEYPLSAHAAEAKARLENMKRPVPAVDEAAYAREKYELDNRTKRSLLGKAWGPFGGRPDMTVAAKAGTPQMTAFHPGVPASIPAYAAGAAGTSANPTAPVGTASDVTVSTVNNSSLIDTAPDARANGGAPGAAAAAAPAAAGEKPAQGAAVPAAGAAPAAATAAAKPPNPNAALPQNHTGTAKPRSLAQQQKDLLRQQGQMKKMQAKQKKAADEQAKKDAKKKKKDNTTDQKTGTTTPPASTGTATPPRKP